MGGFITKGRFIFKLPGGVLTADFESRLSEGEDPFTTGSLALPTPPAKADDQLFMFVTDATVTGGTKDFAHATGTVTNSGFGVDHCSKPPGCPDTAELKWGNAIYVLDLQLR